MGDYVNYVGLDVGIHMHLLQTPQEVAERVRQALYKEFDTDERTMDIDVELIESSP